MKPSTLLLALTLAAVSPLWAQSSALHPDAGEIPMPPIPSQQKPMPGVDKLPVRVDMPDPLILNNGKPVKTAKDWQERRAEIRRTLEYYAVGQAPPPPGNVKGNVISSELVLGGKVRYRLVHLTFGPQESLALDIGIFSPIGAEHMPTIISPSGTPPGASVLARLPNGVNQGRGQDVLLVTGPMVVKPPTMPPGMPAPVAVRLGTRTAQDVAASNPALAHGYNFVTFNNNDCGEDTTLRLPDGSWAYRTTRFYTAYPQYDWGLLQAWAWGVSRIVDYLETDASIDKTKLIVTGVSRTGKSALVAGAFDDRIAMVGPVASSGGGTPAYRFSGEGRGGKEGLVEMLRKYPNWFSPNLHQFWGQTDKLPFDEDWFVALCAPRPFLSLEGTHDQNVNINGVYKTFLGVKPVYAYLKVSDKLGVSFADRPHGMVQGDWDAMLAFSDKFLLGKSVDRSFEVFPPELLKSESK